jgi:Uma2 family endonuclease
VTFFGGRPHPGPWTEADWLAIGETKERIELFDGVLFAGPLPGVRHQVVAGRLLSALHDACDAAGLELYPPVNVRLRPGRIAIPDLSIVDPIDRDTLVADASSWRLVAEIVAPESAVIDRLVKMHYYAEAAIPWYLLVETEPETVLRLFRIENGRYVEHAVGRAGAPLKLTDPVDVLLDLADLDR